MPSVHAAIGCIAERSSFNAGLILARTLRQRGHLVSFVGTARQEFRQHVERHGYGFVSLQSPALARLASEAAGAAGVVRKVNAWRRAQAQLRDDLARLADQVRPDLAFLDVLAWNPAAALLSARRTPTFLFHGGMLSARFSSRYPPVWSSLVPPPGDSGLAWRLRCVAAWAWARVARRRRLMASGRRWLPALLEAWSDRQLRRVAVQNGWPFCWGDWGPQPALPEIVLSHPALDWPHLHTADRCYLSGGAPSRREFDTGWASGLDDERPLVYAVISTMIREADVFEPGGNGALRKRALAMKRFLDAIVAAVAARREWQLLLACGPFARTFGPCRRDNVSLAGTPGVPAPVKRGEMPSRPGDLPTNVHVVERAPQTEVLRRAAVMITQAGAGAVREAASFGVPTLLFPLWTDQFGNSARLVHHGMGERLDYRGVDAGGMAAAIGRMLDQPAKEAAARMGRQCALDAETEVERFVEFVHRHSGVDI